MRTPKGFRRPNEAMHDSARINDLAFNGSSRENS